MATKSNFEVSILKEVREYVIIPELQSCLTLCDPMGCTCEVPLSWILWAFHENLHDSPPSDIPNPGIKPGSLMPPALAGGFFTTSTTWEVLKVTIYEQRP